MLFNTEEKNLMVGAFTTGGLSAIFDGYYGYRLAGGTNIGTTPSDPAYWLYYNYNFWLPNLGQLAIFFGLPGLLYYMGKRKHSNKMRLMGIGGLLYGVSEYVGSLAFRASAVASGQTYRVVGVR